MRQTQVWLRNPHNYIREVMEAGGGANLFAWDRGLLAKRRIDPVPFVGLHFGPIPFRTLLVGDQGTAEIGPDNPISKPMAVYPTWTYGVDEPELLFELIENPVGENPDICSDESIPADERPVFGQEHRVVIIDLPPMTTSIGRRFMAWLKVMQEDNPQCTIHLHGLYSFKYGFGMGFGAADMDPRTSAAQKNLQLASGAVMPFQRVQANARWVTVLGMSPGDLDSPSKRCVFNIRSLMMYARQSVAQANLMLKAQAANKIDTVSSDSDYVFPATRKAYPASVKFVEGDKTLCNSCSIQQTCKQFRVGEVCSLPEGNTVRLAKFFQTRDSQTIIDGLGTLLAMQSHRLEQAAGEESVLGDVNPEVTKMINALFSQGVQLAKLVDPALRGGGVKVNVGVINGQASASVSSGQTPSELTGQVVRALELQGIPRDKITPDLVMATLKAMASPEDAQRAIEGTVISQES
jgi:hypothetical protein